MNDNHELLNKIGVGHPELEKLVELSIKSGAIGAKFLNEIASFLEEPINLLA